VIAVRPAGRGDATVLAELRYAFRSEMAEPTEPETQFLERATRWLADRLGGSPWTGWMASAAGQGGLGGERREDGEGGEPVGLVLVQLIEKVPNPILEAEVIGYVSSLYVRPQWRGHGIGGRLLTTALEHCRHSGAENVVLWPSPRSIPLYQRHGFRSVGEVMELRLASDGASENTPGLDPAAQPLSSRPAEASR
jgi:GNAT superfamily N-acetyltransferase